MGKTTKKKIKWKDVGFTMMKFKLYTRRKRRNVHNCLCCSIYYVGANSIKMWNMNLVHHSATGGNWYNMNTDQEFLNSFTDVNFFLYITGCICVFLFFLFFFICIWDRVINKDHTSDIKTTQCVSESEMNWNMYILF